MSDVESHDDHVEEDASSRKRASEETQDDGVVRKKQNVTDSHRPLLKLLVPNFTAGSLIGKGGAHIHELQDKFSCTLRLSHNREYYPGSTVERIAVITGEISQIIDLNAHIMEKLGEDQSEYSDKKPRDTKRGQLVKIVLTNAAAGMVIGRGGATIKAIQEETKVKIAITNRENSTVPGERVLTMTGAMDERLAGCRRVIELIAGDESNMANTRVKYFGAGTGGGGRAGTGGGDRAGTGGGGRAGTGAGARAGTGAGNYGGPGAGNYGGPGAGNYGGPGGLPLMHTNMQQDNPYKSLFLTNEMPNRMSALSNHTGIGNTLSGFGMPTPSNQGGMSKYKTSVEIKMEVPDVLVGSIMGKQGQTRSEFIQFSGAKIRFSSKNDFAPGTTDRILTISGDFNQTQTAHYLINQKVEQAQHQFTTNQFTKNQFTSNQLSFSPLPTY